MGLEKPSSPVPLKIAIPLIQAASIEDDNGLQDRWAMLLANAANAANADNGIEVQRSYVSILEELSALEAQILDRIYALPFDQTQHNGIVTTDLPHSARPAGKNESKPASPSLEVCIALGNLERLGCLRIETTMGNGEVPGKVNPTILGQAFTKSCSLLPE